MNVLVVDKNPINAIGCKKIFEDHFKAAKVHNTNNGEKAIHKLNTISFDVVVMDIVLQDTDAQSLLYEILRIQPKAKILIFSNNQDEIFAMPYISMGASGYLNKTSSEADFVLAINMIITGQLVMSQHLTKKNANKKTSTLGIKCPFQKLSKRELELFDHLIKGERIQDISKIMNIAPTTAATLKKRIMVKLNVKGMVDLIKVACEFGYA